MIIRIKSAEHVVATAFVNKIGIGIKRRRIDSYYIHCQTVVAIEQCYSIIVQLKTWRMYKAVHGTLPFSDFSYTNTDIQI